MPRDVPADVAAIRAAIVSFLDRTDEKGRVVGDAQYGVYAFYDYDGEPIYVGQTVERLRVRIRRHLTNQRTDAVAMNVLDPFEVAEIEMWPFFDLTSKDAKATLGDAEFTVYQQVLKASSFGAVLNEKNIPAASRIKLPPSARGKIIPDGIYEARKHPDVRIARRSNIIAALARVISEGAVSPGLRRTLLTQAWRLEKLAKERLEEMGGETAVDRDEREDEES
ncbi:MAG: GIY-YIG nuclease family protein [Planctomycetes bacterium]|nr:GIY-YIG nuclease family protein [Planctomycetota bacterium]